MRVPNERLKQAPFAVTKGPRPKKVFTLEPDLSPADTSDSFAFEEGPPATPAPELTASPADLYELGMTAAAMSYHTAAIEALRECTARAPDHAPAWRKLAELLRLAKQDAQADAADTAARSSAGVKWKKAADTRTPAQLEKAQHAFVEPLKSRLPDEAAMALSGHLAENPLDTVAMRFLARLEARRGDQFTARALYERALDLCPAYVGAREDYCYLLVEEHDYAAIAEVTRLLAEAPDNPRYRFLHANALMNNDKVETAIGVLTDLLHDEPHNVQLWLHYGNALRVMGRREEAVQAYRKCLEVQPDTGSAWWGLAELKDKVLTQDDITAMRAQLDEHGLPSESRMATLYALGATLERGGNFAESFAAYEEGAREYWAVEENRKKESEQAGPPEAPVSRNDPLLGMDRFTAVFSRETLSRPAPVAADPTDTPIFVVGMPRAGSTLLEQILASHSRVEGIGERPLIGDIKRELARSRMLVVQNAYPECVLEMTPDQLAAIGAKVIAASKNYRTTDRPYFVDKRVWNWQDVGLIHLILPQAKIIDIRREPMASCFAMYKQMLPRDACDFSYDFKKLGPYYNRYVRLMDYWHEVLPGRVHFVRYERLVEDTEGEIRGVLDYCGLPFEEGCLRFWELDRAIVTPSAEQVRRPIYRHAMAQWRNFEPWLGPLKEALAAPLEA